jgi:hypothetical protein
MRICRLNRIKIKNPEKWDCKANYEDFVEDCFIESAKLDANKRTTTANQYQDTNSESITLLTINEEVTIFEYAPAKF